MKTLKDRLINETSVSYNDYNDTVDACDSFIEKYGVDDFISNIIMNLEEVDEFMMKIQDK